MVVINITHTSSHVPAFHLPRLNYYLGWLSFDVCLGCSYDIWSHEHVVGHHQYTNVIEIDPNGPDGDDGFELFRGSPNQKWSNRFYYQFIWLPLISWLIVWDYRISSIRFWLKGYRKGIRVGSYYLTKKKLICFLIRKISLSISHILCSYSLLGGSMVGGCYYSCDY
jgi:fatty acid desaturase